MQALIITQKYNLLKNPKQPHKDHAYFPYNTLVVVIILLGMHVWLSVHPWLMIYCDRWMVHSVLLVLFFVLALKYAALYDPSTSTVLCVVCMT